MSLQRARGRHSITLFKNRYKITGETLGFGGFGQVVVGEDTARGGRLVGAKIVSLGKLSNEAQLRREAAIMRRAASKHVCAVYGSGVWHNRFVIVQELCSDGELGKLVQERGALGEDAARGYFHQLIDGVAHLHSVGVIHRDLKLENLMLTHGGTALRIIDFGLAHEYLPLTTGGFAEFPLHKRCGSLFYAAPEVYTPDEGYSYRADVWSCGVILFAMLLAFLPVDHAAHTDWRYAEIHKAQLSGRCVVAAALSRRHAPLQLSQPACELLNQLLRTDPSARVSSADASEHAWLGAENTGGASVHACEGSSAHLSGGLGGLASDLERDLHAGESFAATSRSLSHDGTMTVLDEAEGSWSTPHRRTPPLTAASVCRALDVLPRRNGEGPPQRKLRAVIIVVLALQPSSTSERSMARCTPANARS
eukprot:CAMPEP_0119400782 /NCGR_PEP_ID=MMETSP1334-20130426/142039_1 /TAXON_ID=127549 /ORGANISM="Calcidiscus leptoporus, Strain RCC1130" /LENGTH=421 /DNA_ID=CAMNT_0007424691 /DNA_START=110 /DNA_END=1375 /DNA_ORIENTATION=+